MWKGPNKILQPLFLEMYFQSRVPLCVIVYVQYVCVCVYRYVKTGKKSQ